jgi:transcriptional regulator with XRE-family HTH domain
MNKINIDLKQIRENQRLTQSEFSDILGVSRSTITKIEGGDVKLSKKMIEKLRASFPFEFDKSYSNVKNKSFNVDDLSKTQKHYWDDLMTLTTLQNKLMIVCLAIKNINNNYFDIEKVNELKKIETSISILYKVVFQHGYISEDFSFKISSIVSNSEGLLISYLSELSNQLKIKINNFDDLLLSDLSNIADDLSFPD